MMNESAECQPVVPARREVIYLNVLWTQKMVNSLHTRRYSMQYINWHRRNWEGIPRRLEYLKWKWALNPLFWQMKNISKIRKSLVFLHISKLQPLYFRDLSCAYGNLYDSFRYIRNDVNASAIYVCIEKRTKTEKSHTTMDAEVRAYQLLMVRLWDHFMLDYNHRRSRIVFLKELGPGMWIQYVIEKSPPRKIIKKIIWRKSVINTWNCYFNFDITGTQFFWTPSLHHSHSLRLWPTTKALPKIIA